MNCKKVVLIIAVFLSSIIFAHPSTTAAVDNLVPNPSVENSTNGLPSDWHQGYLWGDLDAQYSYVPGGYDSAHAVKVSVSRYSSGDAKWYFTSQPITPGRTYQFTDWYKATVSTEVVAMITKLDNSVAYLSLRSAAAATAWTQYLDTFTAPTDAQSVSVFHLISRIGSLTTDAFSLKEPAGVDGFSRGLVSVTFDDGWQSIYQNALPLLGQFSIPSTQYIATGFINTPGYMTKAHVLDFFVRGHQIASHTVHHYDLTTLGTKKLVDELKQSRTYLERLTGSKVTSIAAPYGAYNQTTINQVKKYYSSQRTSDVGFNSRANFNRYQLKSQYLTPDVTIEQFQSWLTTARTEKSWLILMYHNVDTSGSAYSVTPMMLSTQLAAIQSSGLAAKTVDQALAEIETQF